MSDTGPQLKLAEPVEGRATSKTRHNFYFYEMVYIEVRWVPSFWRGDLA